MRTLSKMTWVEAKLFLREPMGAFFTLAFPLMLLFLFGGIYGNKPVEAFGGYGTIDVSIPSYTAMIIATTGLVGLTITMSTYRENGILRRLRTTPINPLYILTAQVIVLLLAAALGMVLLIIAGKLVYSLRFDGNALSFAAGFVLCGVSFMAFGFILAGLMPTARTAQIVALGAGYPRELLPENIRKFANYLPLTYVVNLLRGSGSGNPGACTRGTSRFCWACWC
ncbi:MAG: ABC transporter permease [Anaerolineae bacterium]|nr:ABC transporter permease [Anaerolineae bacterium]